MAAPRGRRKNSHGDDEPAAEITPQSSSRRSTRLRSQSHEEIQPIVAVPQNKKKAGRPRSKSVPAKFETIDAEISVDHIVNINDDHNYSIRTKKPRSLSQEKHTNTVPHAGPETKKAGTRSKSTTSTSTNRKRSKSTASTSSESNIKKSTTPLKAPAPASMEAASMDVVSVSQSIVNASVCKPTTAAPVLSLSLTNKIRTNSADKIKNNIHSKRAPRNELTSFIPGYTAPLRLDSSMLNNQRPGLETLRKRALTTDKSTMAFVKGTVANQQQILTMAASKASNSITATAFKNPPKKEAPNHAGDQWFNMVPTPLTDAVKHDLNVIKSRNYLDPKRFYKSSDKASKFMQIGTVIEGNAEYHSARLTKKQRRTNLTEEMMADPATADYAKRKYAKMQQAKSATHKKQHSFKKHGKKRFHA